MSTKPTNHGKPWTLDELRLVAMQAPIASNLNVLARTLDRTGYAVMQAWRKLYTSESKVKKEWFKDKPIPENWQLVHQVRKELGIVVSITPKSW